MSVMCILFPLTIDSDKIKQKIWIFSLDSDAELTEANSGNSQNWLSPGHTLMQGQDILRTMYLGAISLINCYLRIKSLDG